MGNKQTTHLKNNLNWFQFCQNITPKSIRKLTVGQGSIYFNIAYNIKFIIQGFKYYSLNVKQ